MEPYFLRAIGRWTSFVVAICSIFAFQSTAKGNAPMKVSTSDFGTLPDGTQITKFTIDNGSGVVMEMINYGAIMTSLKTPDKNGESANINAGFDNLESYLGGTPYFGATVGRYANRIAGGKFKIGETEYSLATNNGPNSLHGGKVGFDKKVWKSEVIETEKEAGVKFTYVSPAGEEGYPGELTTTATYSLNMDGELKIDLSATTDATTVVNLTNHSYWNLAGIRSGKVYDHVLQLEADYYLSVNDNLIPTGERTSVKGNAFDFTSPKPIGQDIEATGGDPTGYDHCYVLRNQDGTLALAATVKSPASGRVMEVWTTQPGIQFYTGNFLNGSEGNAGIQRHEAFCLETQHYPDSPNQTAFPSVLLQPGETYREVTVHKYSVEN